MVVYEICQISSNDVLSFDFFNKRLIRIMTIKLVPSLRINIKGAKLCNINVIFHLYNPALTLF